MAGTTPRGYPFPNDFDPINVAWDMELLARAVDKDVAANLSQGSSADVAQNIKIAQLQTDLAANKLADDALREFTLEFQRQAINRFIAIEAVNSQQTDLLNTHTLQIADMVGGQVYHSDRVSVTTDQNGFASVFFPPDIFAGGSSPTVLVATQDHAGGNPGFWLEGQVASTASNGFGSQWMARNTNTPFANASFQFGYIAMGIGT